MGQALQDMTKENSAVNTELGTWTQKVLALQNRSSSRRVFSVQKPNVILGSEEAAELEIVNTPKQTWLAAELQNHKRAVCWHGNHPCVENRSWLE